MYFWILSLTIAFITYIIIKAREQRNYFRNYGIPQPVEIPFLGFLGANEIFRRYIGYVINDLYNLNREAKYVGAHLFLSPTIVLRDPELIKSVLVKNFEHFDSRKGFANESSDPLFSKNIAYARGEKWRDARNLLSPIFTSSKMRIMFGLMSSCAENFVERFVEMYRDAKKIDMKDAFTRYSNDLIATCTFGIEVDSLKDPDNEFYANGKRLINFRSPKYAKLFLQWLCPPLARKLGIRVMAKVESDFFVNLVASTIKARDERGINRPDVLQVLMDARDKKTNLDVMDMTAQAFIFFLIGFDTVSDELCWIAHELALNPDVQEKLQVEIDEAMKSCDGRLTYEAINDMAYLDAVFTETDRLHVMSFLSRVCSKEFELPPAVPGAKPYVVKLGEEVLIPAIGIHSDPNYYEDPDKFDPERFLNKKVPSDVLNLSFGLGPRMCNAVRFGTLECKVLIAQLLVKCSFLPCEKTCRPLVYARDMLQPMPEGGAWLKIRPRC